MYTRRISGLLSLLFVQSMFLSACASPVQPDQQTNADDAIKQLAAAIDAAWNKGDAVAFASYWAEDGTVTNPRGQITAGRAEIEKSMAADLAGPMKGTTHKLTITGIYWLKPDVAVADGEAEVAIASGPNGTAMSPWK